MAKNKTDTVPLATFRLEKEYWQAFQTWAKRRGSTASAELTRYVLACIGELDSSELPVAKTNIDVDIDEKVKNAIAQREAEFKQSLLNDKAFIEELYAKF